GRNGGILIGPKNINSSGVDSAENPKDPNWKTVKGKCQKEPPAPAEPATGFSPYVVVTLNITDGLSDLDGNNINKKVNTIRANIHLTVTSKCNGVTVTKSVDFVFDASLAGGWDKDASDFDGDGRTPGGAGPKKDADDFDPSI